MRNTRNRVQEGVLRVSLQRVSGLGGVEAAKSGRSVIPATLEGGISASPHSKIAYLDNASPWPGAMARAPPSSLCERRLPMMGLAPQGRDARRAGGAETGSTGAMTSMAPVFYASSMARLLCFFYGA